MPVKAGTGDGEVAYIAKNIAVARENSTAVMVEICDIVECFVAGVQIDAGARALSSQSELSSCELGHEWRGVAEDF